MWNKFTLTGRDISPRSQEDDSVVSIRPLILVGVDAAVGCYPRARLQLDGSVIYVVGRRAAGVGRAAKRHSPAVGKTEQADDEESERCHEKREGGEGTGSQVTLFYASKKNRAKGGANGGQQPRTE